MKFYSYKNCGTCKKAKKFLENKGIHFNEFPIRDNPPNLKELNSMLQKLGNINLLFNRSGRDYREQNLKDKLKSMPKDKILQLLHSNGNLVKRPFLISSTIMLIGFKEKDWENTFKSCQKL